jgi:hypothetical protein
MCKATLTFVLVLQMLPSLVLAQGTSPMDDIDLAGAEQFESVMPSTRLLGPSSLVATLQRTEGLNGPMRFGVSPRWGWLRQAAKQELGESLAQQPGSQRRGWISRHPALFGALVGAAGGAVSAATMENEWFCSGGDDDCLFYGGSRVLVGAGMGAGVGALVGWLVGLGT